MPSFGSGEATAVASTALSPLVVKAAPDACLAIRPVSNLMCLPPASSIVTSCFLVFFLRVWLLIWVNLCAPGCLRTRGPSHQVAHAPDRPLRSKTVGLLADSQL